MKPLKTLKTCGTLIGFVAGAALHASAANYTLENESATWSGSADNANNSSANTFTMRGEVAVTFAAGAASPRLWSPITVSDGATLTLDMSNYAGVKFLMVNRLVAEGTGKVRVKGNPANIVYGYPGFLLQPISIFRVSDFSFVDSNGEETGDKLIFENMSCILQLPKNGVTYSGAMVAVVSAGIVTPGANGVLALSAAGLKGLLLYDDAALPAGTRISVPTGCTVYECPMSISESYAYSKLAYKTNSIPIMLDGGTLSLQAVCDHFVSGDITGAGTVSMDVARGRSGDERTWLTGNVSYSGEVKVISGTATSSDRLSLGTNTTFSTVTLGDRSDIFFENPDGAFAPAVSVGSLSAATTNSTLHVLAGQTVAIGSFTGRFKSVGGGTIVFANGVGHHDILLGDVAYYSSTPWSDIDTFDASALSAPRGGTAAALGGDKVYANVPVNMPVTAEEGREAKILVGASNAPTVAGGAGQVTITAGTRWMESAALWIDPNNASCTVSQPGDLALPEWIDAVGTDPTTVMTRELPRWGCPLIEGIFDCRPGRTYYSLRNARNYLDVRLATPRWADYPAQFAYIDKANGKNFIHCGVRGSTRRLQIGVGQISPAECQLNPQDKCSMKATLVIMAFKAIDGGGPAIVGTIEGAFARTNTSVDYPIVNSPVSGKIRKNGVEVADPTSTDVKLDAGWQILTVDVSAYTLNGFGMNATTAGSGGSAYGDIIVFTNSVPSLEVVEIERYLADKWGVAYAGPQPTAAVARVVGRSGTVNVDSNIPVALGGDFAGTVNVAEGTVVKIADEALPPEEADLPTEGRVAWYDANKTESFVFATDSTCETEIISMFGEGHTLASVTNGETFLWAPRTRGPSVHRSARGFGPERAWIHFGVPDGGDNLRFRTNPYQDPTLAQNSPDFSSGALLVPFRSAFMAMDSCLGGGSPMLADSTDGGKIRARTTGEYTEPIWLSRADYYVRKCDTRLNGVSVDGETHGFSGGPEVFSFALSQDINASCLGYYNAPNREIEGELLLYSRELVGAERLSVEAYMMHKWCGMLPAGYSDLREAMVTGAGTVETAAAKSPRLSESFSGTLRFNDAATGAISMSIDPGGGAVRGAIVAPHATLSSSASVAINVALSSRLRAGTYVLVDVADSDVSWTVNLPNVRGRSVKTAVTPDRVTVIVEPMGSVMVVK